MGAEEVRDIVNDYDPVTYRLPYEVENKFFRICYKPGDGITSFVDKRTGTEMAGTAIPFFTPVYQRTPLHQEVPFSSTKSAVHWVAIFAANTQKRTSEN